MVVSQSNLIQNQLTEDERDVLLSKLKEVQFQLLEVEDDTSVEYLKLNKEMKTLMVFLGFAKDGQGILDNEQSLTSEETQLLRTSMIDLLSKGDNSTASKIQEALNNPRLAHYLLGN
jgi:hypothetical protein